MKNVTFKLNYDNFGKVVLRSDNMARVLNEAGNTIANRCGDGYVVKQTAGRNRQLASVYPQSREAIRDNSENNTLLKALY